MSMKRFLMFIASAIFTTTAAFAATDHFGDDERPIRYDELPAEAKAFIAEYFAKEEVSHTIMDKGIVWDEYTVVFVSGTKLDFDDDGKWLEVNCRYSEVPAAIVPNQISDYVKSYYPKSKITEIKRERNEWEVKLTGGLELTFNSSFRLTDMDD